MSLVYIKNPAALMWQMMRRLYRPTRRETYFYEVGKLSMALELITVLKSLEGLPIASELARAEMESVLHTLLTELDLHDRAYDAYEQLAEWRKPRFARVAASAPGLSGIYGAGEHDGGLHRNQAAELALASESDVRLDEQLQLGELDVLYPERRSRDGVATSELEEPPDAAA